MIQSSNPSDDFWGAAYARLVSWAIWSDARCSFFADCMLAQARFESANFSSPLYKDSNNCIGYNYYSYSSWQSGPSTHINPSSGTPYAGYKTVNDCGGELADWIKRRKTSFDDVEDIYGYLDTMSQLGYATAPASVYAHAEEYYSVTPTDGVSSEAPGEAAMVVADVVNTATSKVGSWVLIGVVGVLLFVLFGGMRLVRRFRL